MNREWYDYVDKMRSRWSKSQAYSLMFAPYALACLALVTYALLNVDISAGKSYPQIIMFYASTEPVIFMFRVYVLTIIFSFIVSLCMGFASFWKVLIDWYMCLLFFVFVIILTMILVLTEALIFIPVAFFLAALLVSFVYMAGFLKGVYPFRFPSSGFDGFQ